MTTTRLGRSGVRVSRLCLGTWNFGAKTEEAEAFRIMDAALEAGINFFDCANHYPDFVNCGLSEEIVGRWFAQGGGRRERVVMATKVYQPMMDPLDGPNGEPGLSKFKILRHVEGSLRRLQTERIDLYQMHHVDRDADWDEVWETFELLSTQGKICYVGSSNFPAWQLALAQSAAGARHFFGLASEQHKYNLLCRLPELEVLPAAQRLGIGVLAYSPLAGGLLGGRAFDPEAGSRTDAAAGAAEAHREKLDGLATLCEELGETVPVVALAWILSNPAVSCVVLGPRKVEQIEGSLRATELTLDTSTMERLNGLFPGPGGPAPEAYAW